jgi:phage terminase Nu1 subunit (DNA packaging protein)
MVTCRYLRRNEQQCTAEAADPDAEVLLCTKHLARAMRVYQDAVARIGGK